MSWDEMCPNCYTAIQEGRVTTFKRNPPCGLTKRQHKKAEKDRQRFRAELESIKTNLRNTEGHIATYTSIAIAELARRARRIR